MSKPNALKISENSGDDRSVSPMPPRRDSGVTGKGPQVSPPQVSPPPGEAKPTAPGAENVVSRGQTGSSRRRYAYAAIGLALLTACGWYAYDYVTVGRFIVSTDDAYVGADMAIISPKVAANVVAVPVEENDHVKKGDVLVRLDDGDFVLARDQTKAKLATQQAAVATFDAQIQAGDASVAQANAQLDAGKATLAKAEADYARTKPLAEKEFTSRATLDAAVAARDTARAQIKANEAAIATAKANVAVLKSQRAQAEAAAKEYEVAVAKAERDLSFTAIVAPFDGTVGNKSVQTGDYVTPGKRLAAVVPLEKLYIDANLKETQLAGVMPGETAKIRVDALGGVPITGKVESIAPASGSQFSLLPPENATGNFTKIVQRVPVRIAVAAEDAKGKLRPGLSVIVDIDTRTSPDAHQHASVTARDAQRLR